MIIDFHAHFVAEEFLKDLRTGRFAPILISELGTGSPPSSLKVSEEEKWEVVIVKSATSGETRNFLPSQVSDVGLRLEHMNNTGVDKQILSHITAMSFYALDTGLNKEVSASLNDGLAGLARKYQEKFSCMAGVPLQDPTAAAAELKRAVGLGHIGVKIGSNIA